MADNCAPAVVESDAACFLCFPEKKLTAMMVYLLAAILKEEQPMADITPAAIEAASACFMCVSAKKLYAEIVYLLCQLSSGGGPGATTNPIYTGAAPPAAPAFPLLGALFTPDADARLQKWIPGTGWVEI